MDIEISPYHFSGTIEEWLTFFGHSKKQLKKYLSKDQLQKKISDKSVLRIPIDLINQGEVFPYYTGQTLPTIFFEDRNFIALEKPSFCHNHPLTYNEGDNILSYLRSINRHDLLLINKPHYDRGLLYRLDYETSGVMVFAKDELIYKNARNDFSKFMSKKIYHAVVVGDFNREGEHIHYLAAFGVGKKQMRAVDETSEAERAESKIRKIKYEKSSNCSLLEIELKTGVRHQIRVQLKTLGFPILGDSLYGGGNFSRLCLHALNYQFSYGGNQYDLSARSHIFSMP